MWHTQELGYVSGSEITKEGGGGILRKLTTGASILGMCIMRVLVPRWTEVNFPVVISELQHDADTIVAFEGVSEMANNNVWPADKPRIVVSQLTGGGNLYETTAQTLGDIFNELLPGLMPLVLTLVAIYLMKNKNVSAITLIFAIFGLGIVMYALGIMG